MFQIQHLKWSYTLYSELLMNERFREILGFDADESKCKQALVSKSVFSDRGANKPKFLDFLNFTMANLAITFTSLILRRAGSLATPAANAVLLRREFHEKVIDHPRNVGMLDAKKSNVGTGLVGA